MGLDKPGGVRTLLQLPAERRHIHPQGTHIVFPAAAPDLLENVPVGQHLSGVCREKAQKPVFDGREMQLLLVQEGAAGDKVDAERAVLVDGLPRLAFRHQREPPLGHPEPGQQFLHGKGLCKVVVRAGVQGVDLIAVLAPRADHDDGDIRPAADLSDDLLAVDVREAQIEEDDVGVPGGSLRHRALPGVRRDIAVVVGAQRRRDQIADRGIVLRHQDQQFIHSQKSPPEEG